MALRHFDAVSLRFEFPDSAIFKLCRCSFRPLNLMNGIGFGMFEMATKRVIGMFWRKGRLIDL